MKSRTKTLRIVDLFAGIGGLSYPLVKLNNDNSVVLWSEYCPYAQQTYIALHGHSSTVNSDITKLIPHKVPDHDLLLAGFPCQAFSIAGYRRGFKDQKGRGNLFFNIVEILNVKKPSVFLLENVKNLKTHDNGRTYQTICSHLTALNYGIKTKVLNAKDFGLHQNRERIFILGVKNAWEGPQIPLPTEKQILNYTEIDKLLNSPETNLISNFKFPQKNKQDIIRLDAMSRSGMGNPIYNKANNISFQYFNPPKSMSQYFQRFENRNDWEQFIYNGKEGHFLKAVNFINGKIKGEKNIYGFEHWDNGTWDDDKGYQYIYQWRRKYVRRNKGGVCPTLTANMGTGGHNVPLIVCGTTGNEKLIRKLTPEECLAFQGFDKKIIKKFSNVKINNGQKYKQAGNSVPVKVIKKIASSLEDIINNI